MEIEPEYSPLFPTPEERLRWEDLLTRELANSTARLTEGPVVPSFAAGDFQRALRAYDFAEPRPLDELLSWIIASLETGVVHVNHPRYFGLFNPAPTFPAQCADRIAAAFNPQLATATTSPAAVEIEFHVVRAIAKRAGFTPTAAGGHFTSGGSEANCTGLLCALTDANPRFAIDGARGFDGQPLFYVSSDSHLAWLKIAHQCGIGRSAVRMVPTDGSGKMNADVLAEMIDADRTKHFIPVMVVATAGTTIAGMVDPLVECGTVARSFGLWYHVDAAWGGAALASNRLRNLLAGIDQADSITIDAHKWFAATMGCGTFITKRPEVLSLAFHVVANFMPSNSVSLDPYVNSVQWSRRFNGLRMFLSLAAAGWEGYARHVERSVDLIYRIRSQLAERGWTIANNAVLGVLCVRPPAGYPDVRSIVERTLASGRAWVARGTFEGNEVIRICVTHGQTSMQDATELVNTLDQRQ